MDIIGIVILTIGGITIGSLLAPKYTHKVKSDAPKRNDLIPRPTLLDNIMYSPRYLKLDTYVAHPTYPRHLPTALQSSH